MCRVPIFLYSNIIEPTISSCLAKIEFQSATTARSFKCDAFIVSEGVANSEICSTTSPYGEHQKIYHTLDKSSYKN